MTLFFASLWDLYLDHGKTVFGLLGGSAGLAAAWQAFLAVTRFLPRREPPAPPTPPAADASVSERILAAQERAQAALDLAAVERQRTLVLIEQESKAHERLVSLTEAASVALLTDLKETRHDLGNRIQEIALRLGQLEMVLSAAANAEAAANKCKSAVDALKIELRRLGGRRK